MYRFLLVIVMIPALFFSALAPAYAQPPVPDARQVCSDITLLQTLAKNNVSSKKTLLKRFPMLHPTLFFALYQAEVQRMIRSGKLTGPKALSACTAAMKKMMKTIEKKDALGPSDVVPKAKEKITVQIPLTVDPVKQLHQDDAKYPHRYTLKLKLDPTLETAIRLGYISFWLTAQCGRFLILNTPKSVPRVSIDSQGNVQSGGLPAEFDYNASEPQCSNATFKAEFESGLKDVSGSKTQEIPIYWNALWQ